MYIKDDILEKPGWGLANSGLEELLHGRLGEVGFTWRLILQVDNTWIRSAALPVIFRRLSAIPGRPSPFTETISSPPLRRETGKQGWKRPGNPSLLLSGKYSPPPTTFSYWKKENPLSFFLFSFSFLEERKILLRNIYSHFTSFL